MKISTLLLSCILPIIQIVGFVLKTFIISIRDILGRFQYLQQFHLWSSKNKNFIGPSESFFKNVNLEFKYHK